MKTILTDVRQYLIVVLICILLMINNIEHIFHLSVGDMNIFFIKKQSIQVLCPFLNWNFFVYFGV